MRVAIINPVGFDRGGATTLCMQYTNLGFDAIFNVAHPLDVNLLSIYQNNCRVYTYKSVHELLTLVNKYDRLLFFNLWYGTMSVPDNVLSDILLISKTFPDKELCYIHCFRKTDDLLKLLPICRNNDFMFRHIFSLNPLAKTIVGLCPVTVMDMNAVTLQKYEPVPRNKRQPVVFSAGRTEAFKNTTKYLQSIDDKFLEAADGFIYLHDGAGFTFHKNDSGVSCQPQLLSLFDLSNGKTLKSQYVVKHYGETPESNKFNLYPAYTIADVQDRWRFFYAGVCCILGVVSGYSKSNLFNTYTIIDQKERGLTIKKAQNWNESLEYADIEKILYGVPVLFSRMYSKIIGFSDERLIYNSFSDIPSLVKNLSNYYDDARINQYEWLVNKVKHTNDNIIEQFTKDLE